MKKLFTLIAWLLSLILLLSGVLITYNVGIEGIGLIIAGLLVFPPVRKLAHGKTNIHIHFIVRVILVVVLSIVSLVFSANKDAKVSFNQNGPQIIASIEGKIATGDYQGALMESSRYVSTKNPQILALKETAKEKLTAQESKRKLEAVEQAKQADADKKSEQEALHHQQMQAQLDRLASLDSDDVAGLYGVYQELAKLEPDNQRYQQLNEQFTAKFEDMKALMEISRLDDGARKAKIESQFSPFSGAHRGLERYIKQRLNDPDSYDHVETRYFDMGNYLKVFTTYRAKNGFGGLVKTITQAKVSLTGQVLEIVE